MTPQTDQLRRDSIKHRLLQKVFELHQLHTSPNESEEAHNIAEVTLAKQLRGLSISSGYSLSGSSISSRCPSLTVFSRPRSILSDDCTTRDCQPKKHWSTQ